MEHKRRIVAGFLQRLKPGTVWDMGANTGLFSRLAAEQGANVVALDFDALAVERNYQQLVQRQETRVLPLVQDLFNPSPGLGWHHRERMSLVERGPVEVVLALALVHHLAIGNNVPLEQIADFFAELGEHLIIEFVPRDDSQVVRMLHGREGQFNDYSPQQFEASFSRLFRLDERVLICGTQRTIYLMTRSASS